MKGTKQVCIEQLEFEYRSLTKKLALFASFEISGFLEKEQNRRFFFISSRQVENCLLNPSPKKSSK